jgi:hypothetical protein
MLKKRIGEEDRESGRLPSNYERRVNNIFVKNEENDNNILIVPN